MKFLLILVACLSSVFLNAKEKNTFSIDRLKEFYDDYVCDQKQELAAANIGDPCVSFWVATNGNDANPGTEQAPFLTLQRARDAVRALPSSAFKSQDILVYIKEGTYRLSSPLVLDASDSGREGHNVVYAAVPNHDPIISGAVQVTGWSLYDPTLGIYRAYVGPVNSRQLYVNGNRAQRAQTTPYPAGFLPQWVNGGIEYILTALNPPAWLDPTTWTNVQDIEAVIITQWKMMRVPLNAIVPNSPISGLITMQQPAWNNSNLYFDITTNLPNEWSFWQVTRFENAYQFLTSPGQWYLDRSVGYLYYMPLPGEDITTADVELPLLETLIVGNGTLEQPIHNIKFEGLTFAYATWLGPSTADGYVSDQSAQLVVGYDHTPNYIGHDQFVVPTPGNLSFTYANNIEFYGNIFEHLGAVGLQIWTGSNNNNVNSNLFTDISSSAIELGAVTAMDSHPSNPAFILNNNLITNNLVISAANEYVDAAGIFLGFTTATTVQQNTIVNAPWSGIAIGWGWGLLDVGSFPGLGNAYSGMWGTFDTPTPNTGCKILQNKFENFLTVQWDAGAIYSTGQQGATPEEALLIEGNVAYNKRPAGGGNVYYTDGGSRYVQLQSNASYNNPIGIAYYGPPPNPADPFALLYPTYYLLNGVPYGSDTGGCRPYGDIGFTNNYWLQPPLPAEIDAINPVLKDYIGIGFSAVCPYTNNGITYPINLIYADNHFISSPADIPASILSNAGVQKRPPTIPSSLWVLPPP